MTKLPVLKKGGALRARKTTTKGKKCTELSLVRAYAEFSNFCARLMEQKSAGILSWTAVLFICRSTAICAIEKDANCDSDLCTESVQLP